MERGCATGGLAGDASARARDRERPGSALARWVAAVLCLVLLAGTLHVHDARASAQGHAFDAHVLGADGVCDAGTADGDHGAAASCPSALGCSVSALVSPAAMPMPRLGGLPVPDHLATARRGADLLPSDRPPKLSVQA